MRNIGFGMLLHLTKHCPSLLILQWTNVWWCCSDLLAACCPCACWGRWPACTRSPPGAPTGWRRSPCCSSTTPRVPPTCCTASLGCGHFLSRVTKASSTPAALCWELLVLDTAGASPLAHRSPSCSRILAHLKTRKGLYNKIVNEMSQYKLHFLLDCWLLLPKLGCLYAKLNQLGICQAQIHEKAH